MFHSYKLYIFNTKDVKYFIRIIKEHILIPRQIFFHLVPVFKQYIYISVEGIKNYGYKQSLIVINLPLNFSETLYNS